jgi:hypothetical protein
MARCVENFAEQEPLVRVPRLTWLVSCEPGIGSPEAPQGGQVTDLVVKRIRVDPALPSLPVLKHPVRLSTNE